MKKPGLVFLLIGFLGFSCEKQSSVPEDEIAYTDIQPDVEMHTIREYYTNQNPFCDPLPLPNDSLVFFELDLDQNSSVDFKIEIEHYEQELDEYCGHCGIFHIKNIKVIPLNSKAFISIDTLSKFWIRNHDAGELISKDDLWSNDFVTAVLEDGCMIPSIGFDDTYWGLKLDDMMAWIHVERLNNNGISIQEFALNLTKNRAIIAGQGE